MRQYLLNCKEAVSAADLEPRKIILKRLTEIDFACIPELEHRDCGERLANRCDWERSALVYEYASLDVCEASGRKVDQSFTRRQCDPDTSRSAAPPKVLNGLTNCLLCFFRKRNRLLRDASRD